VVVPDSCRNYRCLGNNRRSFIFRHLAVVINTGTTIITFLAVFLIQNTQNRDAQRNTSQLDELIKSTKVRVTMSSIGHSVDEQLKHLDRNINACEGNIDERRGDVKARQPPLCGRSRQVTRRRRNSILLRLTPLLFKSLYSTPIGFVSRSQGLALLAFPWPPFRSYTELSSIACSSSATVFRARCEIISSSMIVATG